MSIRKEQRSTGASLVTAGVTTFGLDEWNVKILIHQLLIEFRQPAKVSCYDLFPAAAR